MANIDDKILRKIQKLLNTAISNLLYGGASDPGWTELEGAAALFETLKLLNLGIKNEVELLEELRGENICEEDFTKLMCKEVQNSLL